MDEALIASYPTADAALASADTPPTTVIDDSETSSINETRSGVFIVLIEHMGKILAKLRSADIPTLNKRLKKQHLPGDVAHLSRSTLRNLQSEVAELRAHFRSVPDIGIVSRREFTMLLKLLKDVFTDLVDLQAIVNDVTLEPALAKKLHKDAYRDYAEGIGKAPKQASGLGWIAAPITKFFVTPAGENSTLEGHNDKSPRPGRNLEKRRPEPLHAKAAPKQQPSTSATTTHISVEFGGSGMIRRATPAAPFVSQGAIDGFPSSPNGMNSELQAQQAYRVVSGPATSEMLAPPTVRVAGTLRPSTSRANRNELLGIFAGAARPVAPTAGGPWQILGSHEVPVVNGVKELRAASSQYFGENTLRQRDVANQRQRLSAVVDAVTDLSTERSTTEESTAFQTAFPERALRPRGLSDSSIRSTFVSHGNPGGRLLTTPVASTGPVPRVVANGSSIGAEKHGVLESLANRFYTFRGPMTHISPINPDPAVIEQNAIQPPVVKVEISRSPARAIPPATSPAPRQGAISPTTVSSSQTGIFGILANSLTGGSKDEGGMQEEEDEMIGATLRHPTHIPRMGRTISGKDIWQ